MRASLIGTGLMGRPMGERLLRAGHELTVWNRSPEKARSLVAAGARLAGSAAEAVAASPITLLMLSDAPAIRAVLVEGTDRPDLRGRAIVQMGTIGPDESVDLAAAVGDAGGRYLEAPVLGSRPQAKEGRLLVMAGGDRDLFAECLPLLREIGQEPRLVGEVGQAAALKLAFNQLIPMLHTGFATAVGMVRRRGLPLDTFMEILRESAYYARAFDAKLPSLRARDFAETNFPTRLLLKDVELVLAECRSQGLAGDALEGIAAIVGRALEAGLGEADYSSLYQVVDPPEEERP